MKFKTAREVYKDAEFVSKVKSEEEVGCDYNYIVANHFSLEKYIKEKRISFDEAFNTDVICRVNIFKDETKSHLQKQVRVNNQMTTCQVFKDSLYYKNYKKDLIFRHGERRKVPLLYLIVNAFSLNKEIIFQTRAYDDQPDNKSSNALKNTSAGKTLFDDSLHSLIEASMFCKANVFLLPIINADGTDVEWHIPIGETEENLANARRLYEERIEDFGEDKSEDFDMVFEEDNISDEEIRRAIKREAKKKQQLDERKLKDQL